MPHITTCTRCGKGYEESSEEAANAPERLCHRCWAEDQEFRYADDDEPCCIRCDGTGTIVSCMDDICHGLGYCIHGGGESICPDCKGKGWIGPEDTPTVG